MGHIIAAWPEPMGAQGSGYDYVLARDGVYVQSENDRLTARVMVAAADVRGLNPVDTTLRLRHGPIPASLLDLAISWMLTTPYRESMFGIRWQGRGYELVMPEQNGAAASLEYRPMPGLVAEFHSHGTLDAFFSRTDDADEQGFRIYGVAGRLDQPRPTVVARVGVYGHFGPLEWPSAFSGVPAGIDLRPYDPYSAPPRPSCR